MEITENTPLDAKWIEPRESSVETVMYLYETIQHKFKIDNNYGEKFVKEHQDLIGLLVNASMLEAVEKTKKK